ncbi:MAG: hypothetical protein Q3M24_20565 [Candidatus Electrothrix aestuarii]|uniref:LPXTG-motif cell wall anchor domain-containing protein n=1 Tax=Candidatus Electrothrix aestuarii TaxID=3062594 RepID=A0AAU8LUW2_9BACT|nr:hypothetical protein [Candidatus Electrothrix aestuarii]
MDVQDLLVKAGHWVVANKEWLFSGVGVAVAGWLLVRLRRKPEPPEPVQESGSGMRNTWVHSQKVGSLPDEHNF